MKKGKNTETQSARMKKVSKNIHFDIMQAHPSDNAMDKFRKPSFYQTGGSNGQVHDS